MKGISTFSDGWISKLFKRIGNQTARYSTAAGQQLSDNVVSGPINFGSIIKDQNNLVTVGAGWKYTPSIACDIHVTGAIRCDLPTGAGVRFAALVRRYDSLGILQEEFVTDDRNQVTSTGYGGSVVCRLDCDFSMNLGDYIQIYAIQGSGAARNLSPNSEENWISFSRIFG